MEPPLRPDVIHFDAYEMRLPTQELFKNGLRIRLAPQAFQILRMLVERRGELVTREQLRKALWSEDTFVDFDHGLNNAIKRIRDVLIDSAEAPRYIETLPRLGYRFIGPVDGNGLNVQASPTPALPSSMSSTRSTAMWAIGLGLLVLTVIGWFARPSLPPPKIIRTVQLTSDGSQKGGFVTDGVRIYFGQRTNNSWTLASVPVVGGEVVPIRTPFKEGEIISISPDKSGLLFIEGSIFQENPLWQIPVTGGAPRRLSNILARGAALSPDGRSLAYVNGNNIYLAKADGTESRKLPLTNSDPAVWPWKPVWSPDGKRLRFDLYTMNQHTCSLWEYTEKEKDIHRVFPDTGNPVQRCMGAWTQDQKYYLYQAWDDLVTVPGGAPVPDIWAVREAVDWFHKSTREPVQLTVGPVHFDSLTPGTDGKTIYAHGYGPSRGELTRYDGKTRKFSLYLAGISADGVTFSRDGGWVAYVKYPQGELWRCKADGSEALQLTFSPLVAYSPSWSPDGKRIAFSAQKAGTTWQPYIVAADGSDHLLQPLADSGNDPSWSPDGNSLLLGPKFFERRPNLHILDLKTNRLSLVPGSEGLWFPQWSPDGQQISATSATEDKLMVFDRVTQKWTLLARTELNAHRWSRDGKYVYFARTVPDPGIFRIAPGSSDSPRKVASLEGLRTAGFDWFNLDSSDQPLILQDITPGSEIYALQWEAP